MSCWFFLALNFTSPRDFCSSLPGTTCKPGACLIPIWGRPRTWTSASENPVGALLLVTMALLTTEPGESFHLCQGLLPGYSGMKWVSSRILFELSGSKAAANNHFSSLLAVVLWQLHELQMVLLSCTASSTGTWVNQLATLVQQLGCCRITTFSNLESLGTFTRGNCYVIVKKYCAL